MSSALSPRDEQPVLWADDPAPSPLLSDLHDLIDEPAEAPEEEVAGVADPRFLRAELERRVLAAAGEVESAEWALDRTREEAAWGGAEIGVGLDVEPVDSELETARWSLDQAVRRLHAELHRAARHGLPVEDIARAASLEPGEVGAVLAAPERASENTGAAGAAGGLAAVV